MLLCVSVCVQSKIKIITIIENAFSLSLRSDRKTEQAARLVSEGF